MRKIILVGKSGSGKTTLIQRAGKQDLDYRKTQMVGYSDGFIDTPGEYLELRHFNRALIVTAADADVIGFVQECGVEETYLPPLLASVFPKEVIGIVTKIDLARGEEDLSLAREVLRSAGVTRIFEISALKNKGVDELLAYLFDPLQAGIKTNL